MNDQTLAALHPRVNDSLDSLVISPLKTAILEVEGKMEGETLRGEITLIKEGEHWMATKTSW